MKDLHLLLFSVVAIAAWPVATAHAQHEGHQVSAPAPAPAPSPAIAPPPNAGCAKAARKAVAIIDAIHTRTGADPTGGEAADRRLAELQRAVAAAQAELFVCQAAVPAESVAPAPAKPMSGMDHSKMNMGTLAPGAKPAATGAKPAAPGAKPADPMAGMDHSKMIVGAPAAAKPPAAGTKPAARGAKPAADPMAGMDHSKMGASAAPSPPAAAPSAARGAGKLPVMMAERIADPSCPDKVGQADAPKAVFARKVYYFCSVAARDEFRKDPAAYLKKHPR